MDTIGDLKRTEKLLKIINEKGVAWAAAALVSGSIGYYSPSKALRIIENFLKEKKLYGGAERTCCCFKGDPYAEMLFDFTCFTRTEMTRPEETKRLQEVVKALAKESTLESWGFSAAFPTMGF